MAAGFEFPESGGAASAAVAFELLAPCSSPPGKLPRRVRERLMETKSPPSVEEIEAKLRHAGLRRQVRRPPSHTSFASYRVLVPAPSPRFSVGRILAFAASWSSANLQLYLEFSLFVEPIVFFTAFGCVDIGVE